MHAIEIRHLSKSFGRTATRALDDVSLIIGRGEMVALIGASGSGKSTLLRHVAGLIPGDRGQGEIRVLGQPVQANGRIDRHVGRVRPRIGFVFQQFNLVGRLPVLTNVLLGTLGRIPLWRGTLGWWRREEKLQAMAALGRVGIDRTARQRASTLSGGQQQRAAIARALVQQAEVILADEPIASLDPASAERVMEALSDINRREAITVVVSLHQVDYAIRYCPRTVALRDGRIVFDGPSAALTPAMLKELYGAESDDLILGRPVRAEPSATPARHVLQPA